MNHAVESTTTGAPAVTQGRRTATLLLTLLSLGYLLAYFDRLLMSVVGEMVKTEFALSDKELSLLNGAAFVVIYGLCGIPMGWLGDRFSRKKIVAVSLTVWSVLTMVCGTVTSFFQLAFARAGVGIGESGLVPVANSLIADAYPVAKRPMATAVFYTGGMVGLLLCFVAGSWVAAEYGWRMAFLVAGPPGLLLALLTALFAREPERERIATAAGERTDQTFKLVATNRALVWTLAGGAVATFVNMGVITFLPNFFIRSHGLSLKEVGLYFGPALSGGMAAGMLIGGWIGNRVAATSLTRLIWLTVAVQLSIIPLYLLIFWLPSLELALTFTFIGTAFSVLYSPSYSAAWQTLCHPRARGTAAGMSSFANAMIGGAALPYVVGMLSDHWAPTLGKESLRYALTVSMVFVLAAVAMFIYAARLTERKLRSDAHVPENSPA